MRILFFFLLILFSISCDHPKKPYIEELTWPKRTVKLDNDLGTLTIRLPEEFDTFYTLKFNSDNYCDDLKQYRFLKSKFPLTNQKGWYPRPETDSMYYFTLSHPVGKNCNEKDYIDTLYLSNLTKWVSLFNKNKPINFEIVEISKMSNLNFAVIADTVIKSRFLIQNSYLKVANLRARTFIKNSAIDLEFNCATHNCDSFIPKMYKALKTVEIK